MKAKYKINKDNLIITFNFFYDCINNPNNIKNIKNYINFIIKKENIKFNGNKITIYINGILIGVFYLTNYYLNRLNLSKKTNILTNNNSYFYEAKLLEISPKGYTKSKKVLSY